MILVIFIKAVAELGVIPYTHLFIQKNMYNNKLKGMECIMKKENLKVVLCFHYPDANLT